ncbi:MAG TPA: glycosyltransferase [Candidatus Cloacimonas sp.]|jgi:cellulose synthase/poly-beta-1,6-N-acetylglucosamine synthase-like glycosyltransferase|nr:glycosyltransferase [Candidatus Cloacimonas sp.]MDD2250574.1 glycosyltransferase [Candidatus Cloacimonadota bacterium]MCK9165031.1 glycosyltransferase [Candidatus Cloacimonas sp.]MDD4676919.1 glycosyltransferase [Candidatus Cloacimonadota bacterium]HNV92366.1 glycosyltransferase [Candidatus Cloacimonas sp.]
MNKIKCSVGIFAHNEAANIIPLLQAVENQELQEAEISEIIVVSSASTDGTDTLVSSYAKDHNKVTLFTQPKREGKSSAINLFLANAKEDIVVIISADVIPQKKTIEKMVSAFKDPKIGATGGRPVPVNDENTYLGYVVHLLWRLHHRMALISPKLGEMIAFRKVMKSIPKDSAVDEASIEAIIKEQGYKLKYIPSAIIKNKGSENLSDHIKQRRRIQNGHLWLKAHQHYKVSSQDSGILLKVVLQELIERPGSFFKLALAMLIEIYCRLLGSWDYYIKGKNPFAWEIARSTKELQRPIKDKE